MAGVPTALIDWWRRRRWSSPRVDHIVYRASLDDVADDLDRHAVIVVGTPSRPRWAVLECPCGRGHRLTISLQRSHDRHWELRDIAGAPDLAPSIDSMTGYRCHFWLRAGRVTWAPDVPASPGR